MRRLLTVFCVVILISGVVSAAGRGSRADIDPPQRYSYALDGVPVQALNPIDGRLWSAWSYRNGAEYDLALSASLAPGVWTEPQFIGLGDGVNQLQPAITVDSRGATYIAYADGNGSIRLTALQPGTFQWSSPILVAAANRPLSDPSLIVVGNTLVVGYRDGAGVALQALPLLQPDITNLPRSIYDGPDPTTGADGEGEGDGEGGDNHESSRDEPAIFGLSTNNGVGIAPQSTGAEDDDRR